MWLYPDGSRILEISTKCLPHEAFQAALSSGATSPTAASRVGASQETKTKTALEYFGAQLAAGQNVAVSKKVASSARS